MSLNVPFRICQSDPSDDIDFNCVVETRIDNQETNYTVTSENINFTQALIHSFDGVHVKCRDIKKPYARSEITRQFVPDAEIAWAVEPKTTYNPPDYTDSKIIGQIWADPEIQANKFKWNQIDGKIDRRSFVKNYEMDKDGRPLNPIGRTGLRGRGVLGKWGPNHAADPIVTRWKRDANGGVTVTQHGKKMLQFVSILRGDCRQWAIPGGMVDACEAVSETLKREFLEEGFDSNNMSSDELTQRKALLATAFSPQNGILVYQGYVDDPRNTDNSWMETNAVNFHDETGNCMGAADLKAGDDAVGIQWKDIDSSMDLYASHKRMIEAVATFHNAHW